MSLSRTRPRRPVDQSYGNNMQVGISTDILPRFPDIPSSPHHASHPSVGHANGQDQVRLHDGNHGPEKTQRKTYTVDEIRNQEIQFRSKLLGAPGVSFNFLPVHPLGIVDIKKPDFNAIPELADPPPLIHPEKEEDHVAPIPMPRHSPTHVDPADVIMPIFNRTATYIHSLSWLDTSEQHELTKVFMSEVARRYHEIHETILRQHQFSTSQINLLMSLILDRASDQSELALEKCRRRRKQMDTLGVMASETIKGRLGVMYRLELDRRIIIRDLLATVMSDIIHGVATLEVDPDWKQLFTSQLEDLKHRLPEEKHIDLQDDLEHIKTLHEKYRRAKLAEPFIKHKFHLSKEEQEQIMTKYGMVLSDLGGLINATPRKTVSRERERAKRTLRDGCDYNSLDMEDDGKMVTGASDDEFENDDLHLSTMGEFSLLMRGDPLLDAHTTTTTFNRRQHDDAKPRSPRKRYLPQSDVMQELLTSYDYSIIDEIPVSATQPSPSIADYIPITAPDGTILRAADFRVSKRTPKGTVLVNPSPPLVVSEFSGMIDQAALDALDSRLARYKEVEELYDEIMKTLVGRNWQAETADEEENGSCPAAPFEPGMAISYAFQGLAMPKKQLIPAGNGAQTPQSTPTSPQMRPHSEGGPEIRLRTDLLGISPKEYLHNRKSAMDKTASSRAVTHTKFNFGGYIPASVASHLKHPDEDTNQVSMQDYVGFLKTKACDFILEIMADQDEDEEAYKRFVEEQEKLRREEKEAAQIAKLQKERDARYERRRHMTSFSEGNWNPLILDYFDVLKNNEIPPELDEENAPSNMGSGSTVITKSGSSVLRKSRVGKPTNGPPGTSNNGNNSSTSRNHSNSSTLDRNNTKRSTTSVGNSTNFSTMSVSSKMTVDVPPPPTNLRTFPSMINIHKAQEDLHKVWIDLKTPFGEQCRMAARYGSHRYSSKLENTVSVWKEAGRRVLEREGVIQKLKDFEKEASNPDRLFGHGHDVSSEIRMEEARKREEILNELRNMEESVVMIARRLKAELKETLSYEGVSYVDKITHDITSIIYKASGRSERPTSASKLPPIPDTRT